MSGGGTGRRAGQADDHDPGLDQALFAILDKVSRRGEITAELAEEALKGRDLVLELWEDRRVRARAATARTVVVEHELRIGQHRAARPAFADKTWRPGRIDVAAYVVCALAIIASLVVAPVVLGYGFFGTMLCALALAIFCWVAVLHFFLPVSVLEWEVWAAQLMGLRTGLFGRRWRSQLSIRDEVVLPMAREWINDKKQPSYALDLLLRDDSGLRAPSEDTPLVPTAAIARFQNAVRLGGAGAVGVAGRRGAGKTTLVGRALEARTDGEENLSAKYLEVSASAPVRYDAREFVLHLHAVTCRAVLDRYGGGVFGYNPAAGEDEREWTRLLRRVRIASTIQFVLARLGTAIATALAAGAAALGAARTLNGQRAADQLIAAGRSVLQAPLEYLDSQSALTLSFELFAGLALLDCTFSLLSIVIVLTSQSAQQFEQAIQRWQDEQNLTPEVRALRILARHHLRRIRFLQTRTEGWSGKLAATRTVGLGVNRSVQSAEQPLTQPEVVDQYRSFLTSTVSAAATVGVQGVIVAIDELDKITDPGQAQQFINEIKGIFGVDGATFVVAVSDDALTAFDRRGIPIRDAFESAFRDIIHVNAFTLHESHQWLARRALGISEPFVCLCHCLSGGLPRELQRVAIALADIAKNFSPLDKVTSALIEKDLRDRLRGFSGAANQISTSTETSRFLRLLNDLPPHLDVSTLFALRREITPNQPKPEPSPLEQLQTETATYLYFCATLLQVFTMSLTEDILRPATAKSYHTPIEMLAFAREHMALDPTLSDHLLSNFRKQWHLNEK